MNAPVNNQQAALAAAQAREQARNRERLVRDAQARNAKPAPSERGRVEGRRMGADTLTLGQRPARPDGTPRPSVFDRADANRDGSLSKLEFRDWRQHRAERLAARAAAPAPESPAPEAPAAPAPPPAFGYQTQHAHDVAALARDFGVTPEALMEANGWTDPARQVPAGTSVNVPDTPETRAKATEYGGQVGEARAPGEAPAPGSAPQGAPAGLAAGGIGIAGDGDDVHMTQFVHERFNNSPDAPLGSANCGPTSLAMGLKAVGLQPAGLPAGADTEAWIDTTRQAMGAMTDAAGRYGDHAYTDISQVIAGAEASGATTAPVDFANLDAALVQGLPVVSAGNPAVYNYDWVARGISNSAYDGGHFITITGKAANGNYVINDPLSNVGTVEISPQQMAAYMGWFGAGSAVSIANPHA